MEEENKIENRTGKLEKEFKARFANHKFAVVASSLAILNFLYEEPLMAYYKDKFSELNTVKRAKAIVEDMRNNQKALYDAMYDYCWQYIDDVLPEDTCYKG